MNKIIVLFVILINLFSISLAHSGRTDYYGGHYDSLTGIYHYHHGYIEHQHINELCPYEAEIEDLMPDTCQKCKTNVNIDNGYYCFECGYELVSLSGIRVAMVDGSVSKTRSEYFKEVEQLNKLMESKDMIIDELYDMINQKQEEIINLKSEQSCYLVSSIFILLIVMIISYYIGLNRKDR